ncbi:MAG: methyltransferase domain-containing protein, partial [Candidatus Binatia bacterium]
AARERQSRESRGTRGARGTVDYRVADARRLGDVSEAGSFDLTTCALALANLAPLAPVFAGIAAALAPNGRFAAVLMHPCFRIPRASSWGWDEEHVSQYRRIDRYLSSNRVDIRIHPGADPSQTVPAYHRPLEAYVNALAAAGLVVDRLEEWPSHKTSPAGPRKRALDESRDEIPMFLALRARRAV